MPDNFQVPEGLSPGEVPRGGRSAWHGVAAIALLAIAAIGYVAYRHQPGLLEPALDRIDALLGRTRPGASTELRSRQSVRPSFTLDLESGSIGDKGVADLWWRYSTRIERYLDTRNGAKLARVAGDAFEQLDAAQLARLDYRYANLKAWGADAMVRPGTLLAVRTAEGNLAKVRVLQTDGRNGELEVEWVLYRAPPAVAGGGPREAPDAWSRNLTAAGAAYRDKRLEESERLFAEALAGAERFGAADLRVALVLNRSGSVYWSMRKLEESERRLLRAAEILDRVAPGDVASQLGVTEAMLAEHTHRMLGVVYQEQRRDADAAAHYAKAVAAAQSVALAGRPENFSFALASDLLGLARSQCRLGRSDEANRALTQARAIAPQHASTAWLFKAIDQAESEIAQGRPCRG